MKIINNKVQAFFDSGKPLAMVLSVVISVLFVTVLVEAATTLSTNITTDGTITGNYASSTVMSVNNTAYFGGTATTTIGPSGDIVAASTTVTQLALSGAASTTLLSVTNTAFFGGSATTTIGGARGNITTTTTNTATTSLTIGCIQTYATSTATAIRIEFGVNNMASTTFRTGAPIAVGGGGQMVWVYGTCP